VNWNMSAFKQFVIHENVRLQFRADAFNVFNEVNLGNPITTMTAANFGKITSAASPRICSSVSSFCFNPIVVDHNAIRDSVGNRLALQLHSCNNNE